MSQLTLLFDLDGTLADTAPDISLALDATLGDLGQAPAGLELARTWIGGGAPILLHRALSAYGLPADDAAVTKAVSMLMPHYANFNGTEAVLFPGVEPSLRTLRERGVAMAVVTNKPHRFAVEVLEQLRIGHFFAAVIGGDSLPVKKPDPAPLFAAVQRAGGSNEASWMIGDSATDVSAARNAQIRSAWVPYGYHQGKTAADLRPDHALAEFADVLNLN